MLQYIAISNISIFCGLFAREDVKRVNIVENTPSASCQLGTMETSKAFRSGNR